MSPRSPHRPRPHLRLSRVAWCVGVCLWGLSVQAAPASDEEDLAMAFGDQATITLAAGSAQSLRRAPAVATVITADDIAAMGAADLDEVLESVPGLHVSRVAQGYSPQYVIRGIYSEFNPQTLVLQDGVPITMLYVGNRGNVWGGLPLDNVARIEVIRGPGSALYGADAYAGVINIVTKTAADQLGTTVGVRAGSFNTRDAWITHGGHWGAWDVATYLRWGRTDGHRGIVTADAQTVADGRLGTEASLAPGPVNTGAEALDASINLRRDAWRASLSYRLRDKVGTGAGAGSSLDPVGYGRTERWLLDLGLNNLALSPDWRMSLNLSAFTYATTHPRLLQIMPPGAWSGAFPQGLIRAPNTWERQIRGSAVFTYTGWDDHQIRLGIGHDNLHLYRTQEFKNFTQVDGGIPTPITPDVQVIEVPPDQVFMPPKQRRVSYVYLQDEWVIAPDWQLTAGVRHDQFSDFGRTTNPRLALVWDARHDLTVKLLHGRAFRAPSFAELYSVNDPIVRGNPELQPERISTHELVLSWQARADTHAQLSLFRYEMRDIIRSEGLPSTRLNSGRQDGEGFELEARHALLPQLQLSGHYAFQRTADDHSRQSAGYAPRHQLYARADWALDGGWTLGAQANRVAARDRAPGDVRPKVPNYTTVDVNLRSPQHPQWGRWSLSVRNLFDARVKEPSWYSPNSRLPVLIQNDLPQAGRVVMLQWQYSL